MVLQYHLSIKRSQSVPTFSLKESECKAETEKHGLCDILLFCQVVKAIASNGVPRVQDFLGP